MIINPYRFATAPAPGDGDPYWANVSSLLHFDGVNGSTSFPDEKGSIWTAFGSAQVQASPARFGEAMKITSSGGITCPDNSLFNLGASDFTIEMFVYPTNTNPNAGRLYNPNNDGHDACVFSLDSSNNLCVYASSSGYAWNMIAVANAGNVPNNAWTHIAICRSGSSAFSFINGVKKVLSSSLGTIPLYHNTGSRCIGGQSVGIARHVIGSIDEFRLTRYIARYTTDFTPPSAPFPNHG